MLDSPRHPVSRRTALAVGTVAAATALAGCELDPPEDDAPGKGPDALLSDEEHDTDLAGKAARSISTTLNEVRAAANRHVGLAQALAGLVAMHEAHHALLADSGADQDPSTSPSAPVTAPPSSGEALSRVTTSERKLAQRLEDWAVNARSGQFARVLASMAASVAQHVSVLPKAKEPAG
ncbi:hypothetical protein [Nocardioides speluncae]|uniref:hypothetical protein n=1 Tax=Nocardioides speluncae TaxID=2670337 RepID=UPI001F0C5366|nr:hypothetical protein [Nocardioides speluncae]